MEENYYKQIIFHCSGFLYEKNIFIDVESRKILFEYENLCYRTKETFSKELTDEEVAELLPYINILEFEPYRYVDDYDCSRLLCYQYGLEFIGFTGSKLPTYEHSIYFNSKRKEKRPYEKLYSFIINKFLSRFIGIHFFGDELQQIEK